MAEQFIRSVGPEDVDVVTGNHCYCVRAAGVAEYRARLKATSRGSPPIFKNSQGSCLLITFKEPTVAGAFSQVLARFSAHFCGTFPMRLDLVTLISARSPAVCAACPLH